jgi:hypothetical protein
MFTWPAEDLAEMARMWRHSDTSRAPKHVLGCGTRTSRLVVLAREPGSPRRRLGGICPENPHGGVNPPVAKAI